MNGTVVFVCVAIGLLGSLSACSPHEARDGLEARARRLHRDAIVVDTHSDTTPYFEDASWRFDRRHSHLETHMDLPRIREGGLDVQFWSIYTGKSEQKGEAARIAFERIDAVHRLVERHADELVLAGSVAEIRRGVAGGKLVSLMGVEGGHMIEGDLGLLREFYRLGARYLTLTHSFHTAWADSSGTTAVPVPVHGGLTEFGEQVVEEMNRLGMMVDVSHVSDETFFDAVRVSRAPVIASHSSCRAVADHPRNLSDPMLRALAANGGVVMINFYPAYIDESANRQMKAYFERWGPELMAVREGHAGNPVSRHRALTAHFAEHPPPRSELSVLLDHFDHALRVAGPDHVGMGADWDGVPSLPYGMDDVSALPRLTLGLLERGHSEGTVRKLLGENLLRAMESVEQVASELKSRAGRRAEADPRLGSRPRGPAGK